MRSARRSRCYAPLCFLLPRHMCRQLEIPVRKFIAEAHFYPVVLCVPLSAVLLVMRHSSMLAAILRWFRIFWLGPRFTVWF